MTPAVYFSQRGYVYLFQDVRGRDESEGRSEPFRNDIEDGYDTVEWVGMQGGSDLGHVQWRAVMSKPPHLMTIFPSVAAASLYHDWITLNGGWLGTGAAGVAHHCRTPGARWLRRLRVGSTGNCVTSSSLEGALASGPNDCRA